MPYPRNPVGEQHIALDPTVFVGAFALTMLAGFVNASLLEIFDVPTSHMSGAVSRLSIDLGKANLEHLVLLLKIIGGFLLGSIVSGVVIGSRTLRPDRRYGVILLIEAALLAVAGSLSASNGHGHAALPFAALACGMQNAMASSYYGLLIRTTHVTGIITDLGALIGAWIRHRTVKAWKLLFLGLLLTGFFLGGFLAIVCRHRYGLNGLYVASGFCLGITAAFFVWQHVARRRITDRHQATPED